MLWFWRFVLYSFVGFLLEITFARLAHHPKRDRKCLLLLPLCPVYGLGALLILGLARLWPTPLGVMLAGLCGATGAEYLTGLFYRHALGVDFWDYRGLPFQLHGLICLPFSLAWMVLALALVYGADPAAQTLLSTLPPALTPPAAILLAADVAVSSAALRRTGTTEVLRWYRRSAQPSRSTSSCPPQGQ